MVWDPGVYKNDMSKSVTKLNMWPMILLEMKHRVRRLSTGIQRPRSKWSGPWVPGDRSAFSFFQRWICHALSHERGPSMLDEVNNSNCRNIRSSDATADSM